MTITSCARRAGFFAGTLALLLIAGNASAEGFGAPDAAAVAQMADVLAIEEASNHNLLVIGRLDAFDASENRASILGQEFELIASRGGDAILAKARVGDAVAMFGEVIAGRYVADIALVLEGQYVPGVSKVYLRGRVNRLNWRTGSISIGSADLNVAAFAFEPTAAGIGAGAETAAIGTQPLIGGSVLVERIRRIGPSKNASVGTGGPSANASVGTGGPTANASVGTGGPSANASVGTGGPTSNASVGTGGPTANASVGTGGPSANASVGTGGPTSNASVGTGGPTANASVGTGGPSANASVGTGGPTSNASVGTGGPTANASVGTGGPNS
jgi:hypothetical protein